LSYNAIPTINATAPDIGRLSPQRVLVQGLRLRRKEKLSLTSLPACSGSTMHKAIVETTVGDLIVAITDETHQQVRDEKITYELVAYILADLTKNCRRAR
jgi:hypothetical protein